MIGVKVSNRMYFDYARYELSDGQVVDKEINVMRMLIELLGVIK